ncbi:RNA recognition motif domain-containing protein [Thalassotalea marina]|uniref:RNA-binding protein n=1 Tax=Thalassotalea marina TaxID=1673741 RepID=A0A919BQN2_9GAMM|nr:RNA-binding protein [Thalassotalea marina]GHG05671.1 RNA-binding protein [Thalassotalea marina]
MTSPKSMQIVVAFICAGIAFAVATSLEPIQPAIVAIIAFVSALAVSLVGGNDKEAGSGNIKTLYVGNLPYRANEGAVRALFSEHGKVHSVRLMKDKHTGKRRGFGFVEISAEDASSAIQKLNDTEFQQRTLKVREAKERPDNNDEDN